MALLEANVPTEVIALYLGHESPKTTHLYVEASLAMKKQALAKVDPLRSWPWRWVTHRKRQKERKADPRICSRLAVQPRLCRSTKSNRTLGIS